MIRVLDLILLVFKGNPKTYFEDFRDAIVRSKKYYIFSFQSHYQNSIYTLLEPVDLKLLSRYKFLVSIKYIRQCSRCCKLEYKKKVQEFETCLAQPIESRIMHNLIKA